VIDDLWLKIDDLRKNVSISAANLRTSAPALQKMPQFEISLDWQMGGRFFIRHIKVHKI
jgi:hypothetical protein